MKNYIILAIICFSSLAHAAGSFSEDAEAIVHPDQLGGTDGGHAAVFYHYDRILDEKEVPPVPAYAKCPADCSKDCTQQECPQCWYITEKAVPQRCLQEDPEEEVDDQQAFRIPPDDIIFPPRPPHWCPWGCTRWCPRSLCPRCWWRDHRGWHRCTPRRRPIAIEENIDLVRNMQNDEEEEMPIEDEGEQQHRIKPVHVPPIRWCRRPCPNNCTFKKCPWCYWTDAWGHKQRCCPRQFYPHHKSEAQDEIDIGRELQDEEIEDEEDLQHHRIKPIPISPIRWCKRPCKSNCTPAICPWCFWTDPWGHKQRCCPRYKYPVPKWPIPHA